MVSVSEATDWSVRSSIESKYRALRCSLERLPPDEYHEIEDKIELTQHGLVYHITEHHI